MPNCAHKDFAALLKKYDDTVHELPALAESLSDETLYGSPGYEKYILGRMI